MSGPVDPAVFIREFLLEFLESQLLDGRLTTEGYHIHRRDLLKNTQLISIGRLLFKNSPDPVLVDKYGHLRIVYLREPRSE